MNSLIVNSGSQTIMNLLVLVLILFGIGCLIKVIVDFSKAKVDIFAVGRKIKEKSISTYSKIRDRIDRRKQRLADRDSESFSRGSSRFQNMERADRNMKLRKDREMHQEDSGISRDRKRPKRKTFDDGYNSSTPYTDRYEDRKKKQKSNLSRSSAFGGGK